MYRAGYFAILQAHHLLMSEDSFGYHSVEGMKEALGR